MKFAIIVAGGSGTRAGLGINKILFTLGQKTVLETVLDKFKDFDGIIIAAAKQDYDEITKIAKTYNAKVVYGGETRTDSVRNALLAINYDENSVVAIHDAARPFVSLALIEETVKSALENGSGIAAVKLIDSVKKVKDGIIYEPLNREELYAMQTPQTFKVKEIMDAYNKVSGSYSDDAEVYRLAGFSPKIVEGDYENKKLTVPADFVTAQNNQRIGAGFDVHKLVKNRKLILGGVEIPYLKGLEGHSDADVLLHAIIDSLLSATGEKDIGVLFPDTDNKFKDIDSTVLLKSAFEKLNQKRIKINYISAVIIAQKPKLAPFIDQMRTRITSILEVTINQINISATTTEFMGIVGKGKAIAASALSLCSHQS